MMFRLFQKLAALFAIAIGACALSARPQVALAHNAEAASREHQVKAAFIYHFVQFVDWPAEAFANADSAIIVAVVGEDPFKGALDQAVRDKVVRDRRLVVKHFPGVDQIADCHVLVVSPSEGPRLGAILEKVKKKPVLTVSDLDGFTSAGGAVRFFREDNKIRFEIRPKAAERVKLQVRANLLKVAKVFQE
jgi:hypothetical protein